MSNSGLNFKGRPNTEQLETMRILRYCGGAGGGDCLPVLGTEGIVLEYRVQKYITFNRKIVFRNNEFFGVRIYTDGGPVGFCSHSLGNEVTWWMGLSSDPNLDIETVARAGVELSGALPYDIEFEPPKLPQPTDAAWENRVYVYLWWGDAGYVAEGGIPDTDSFWIIKHDKDIKI